MCARGAATRLLSLAQVKRQRAELWRTARGRWVRREAEALEFINRLGFVMLMTPSGADLPSLHAACGHDWGRWWDWKQTLPEQKLCCYTHLLRRRGTFISWEWLPRFLAVYRSLRSCDEEYRLGLMDRREKRILDLLSERGRLLTRELRLAYAPPSKRATRELKHHLLYLQLNFRIVPAGGDTEGWSHHRWDLAERWVPRRILSAARRIPRERAQQDLAQRLVEITVFSTPADIAWAFGWPRAEAERAVEALLARGRLLLGQVKGVDGEVLLPGNPYRELLP
jgi:hypothetical protein